MTGQSRQEAARSSPRIGRRGLLAALGATALGAVAPVRGRAQQGAVWPLFQHDATNTGDAAGVQGPGGAVGARWGVRSDGAYTSTPVVTDDAVFAADARGDAVVAVERATGERRWRVDAAVEGARLSYHDGTLLVPGDSLEGLSPADGERRWSVSMENPYAATVNGRFAFVAALGGVYRVSLSTHEVNWHSDRVTQLAPSVAVTDEYVYAVGTRYGQVISLDRSSGSRRWLRRVDGAGTGAPTVRDDLVYVPSEAALTAMSYESGIPEWTLEEAVGSSVAVAEGTVFATTTGGDVLALDADTGEEQWRASPVSGSNPPIVAGGLLYATGTGGGIAALNPGDGTVIWQSTVGGSRSANVAAGRGELYVGDDDGTLAAVAEGASGGTTEAATTGAADQAQDDPTDGGAESAAPTATEGPGFGLAAGVAGLGGALAARRRRGEAGTDGD